MLNCLIRSGVPLRTSDIVLGVMLCWTPIRPLLRTTDHRVVIQTCCSSPPSIFQMVMGKELQLRMDLFTLPGEKMIELVDTKNHRIMCFYSESCFQIGVVSRLQRHAKEPNFCSRQVFSDPTHHMILEMIFCLEDRGFGRMLGTVLTPQNSGCRKRGCNRRGCLQTQTNARKWAQTQANASPRLSERAPKTLTNTSE